MSSRSVRSFNSEINIVVVKRACAKAFMAKGTGVTSIATAWEEEAWVAGAPDWIEDCVSGAGATAAVVEDTDSSADSESSDTNSSSLLT